ncbi:amino acid permease [Methanocella conradii]|uniref:amino acid permease n=1 Tax=Methanocella conradii TaxID=1175444 RepID=UPI0024B3795A|nr:amino acid permease [Methanocella conradii]MDI6895885.1 amino acid permease [Methanocella conradii]
MAGPIKAQQAGQISEPRVEVIKLKRDLGVFGSFSIGFADVGADIYVALGLVLFFAGGAAPLALAIAALGYIFTALSYAELASAIPMAGGASIFAREAFDDFWGFVAGWGLLLDYTIDIALFGWITMGYLGSFLANLGMAGVPYVGALSGLNSINAPGSPSYTFQAVGTIALCIILMALNYIGIRESANLNIALSIISIISEAALLLAGFALVWSLPTFIHNITQLGSGVSWTSFGWGITVAMVSFIGLESISQAAEETRRPDRTIPRSTKALIVAVMLAGLLLCTLAVGLPTMSPSTLGTTYQNDPVTGVAKGISMGLIPSNPLVALLPLWVGLLGVLMLLMSTNTGVIGASRVTYSMSRHKIMPVWFSKLHPKYRVPTRTIVIFSLASIGFVLFVWFMGTYKLSHEDPTIILGDLYNYGALVSFMLVNLSLIMLRNKRPELYRPYKSPFAFKVRAGDKRWVVPVLPLLGFFVCLFVWMLVLNLHEIGKIVGTLWFVAGIAMYLIYRRSQNLDWREHIPGTQVTHPDVAHELHPEIAHELKGRYESAIQKAGRKGKAAYHEILVPLSRPETVENIIDIACGLLEEGGRLHLMTAIAVPPQLPTQAAVMDDSASSLLMSAIDKAKRRGVNATAEAVTSRSVAEAIAQSAMGKRCDLIVMGSSQRTIAEKVLFGSIVDGVLRSAPCDVAVFSYTNDMKPIRYEKILVPTSGYLHATRALEVAITLQRKFKGSITSMYVSKKAESEEAEAILEGVNRMAQGSGVNHSAIFLAGNVADSIIKVAGEGKYDLIIIGATERPAYHKWLLGSTADEVVKRAPCNVLVVRMKK